MLPPFCSAGLLLTTFRRDVLGEVHSFSLLQSDMP